MDGPFYLVSGATTPIGISGTDIATHLLGLGVHVKVVQEMHGHMQIGMTMHLFACAAEHAARCRTQIADLLKKGASSDEVALQGEQTVLL